MWPSCWGYSCRSTLGSAVRGCTIIIVIAFVLRFALKQTCADRCSGPTTFFGPSIFNASTGTTVALEVTDALLVRFLSLLSCCAHSSRQVMLEAEAKVTLGPAAGGIGGAVPPLATLDLMPFTVGADGHWTFGKASGTVSMHVGTWHKIMMDFSRSWQTVSIDGSVLANITVSGAKIDGWHIKLELSEYVYASFDNFRVAPLGQ